VTIVTLKELITEFSNYPNPFYPLKDITNITYVLNQDADVDIEFYNYLGDRLRKLQFRAAEVGGRGSVTGYRNTITWDGRDGKGILLASSGYICRLIAKPLDGGPIVVRTRKIGLIRAK